MDEKLARRDGVEDALGFERKIFELVSGRMAARAITMGVVCILKSVCQCCKVDTLLGVHMITD